MSGTAYFQLEKGPAATDYEPYRPEGAQALALVNAGRLAVVPTVQVTGSMTLAHDQHTQTLSEGTYQLPDLYLTPGKHFVLCSGEGTATFTYREAVLAE